MNVAVPSSVVGSAARDYSRRVRPVGVPSGFEATGEMRGGGRCIHKQGEGGSPISVSGRMKEAGKFPVSASAGCDMVGEGGSGQAQGPSSPPSGRVREPVLWIEVQCDYEVTEFLFVLGGVCCEGGSGATRGPSFPPSNRVCESVLLCREGV